ncbi:hypothetical protein RND71_034264 [Anisodus tanguticus]|uniref:Uncharacterized protein n=1 Tax=Anisodus tanguticus TaxID=243964 RepID=A0AAE1RA68_9SOLA|nr:hypothetical protein RND71_034264 [Anisodus tanguticus]
MVRPIHDWLMTILNCGITVYRSSHEILSANTRQRESRNSGDIHTKALIYRCLRGNHLRQYANIGPRFVDGSGLVEQVIRTQKPTSRAELDFMVIGHNKSVGKMSYPKVIIIKSSTTPAGRRSEDTRNCISPGAYDVRKARSQSSIRNLVLIKAHTSIQLAMQLNNALKNLLKGLSFSIIVYGEYQNLILKNKISIINAGALEPIICFLQSENSTLQDHATASLLTLSASSVTKPIISSSDVIPRLVEVLRQGGS